MICCHFPVFCYTMLLVLLMFLPSLSWCVHRAMAGDATLSEHYAFCGMQHIFDKHKDASEPSIIPGTCHHMVTFLSFSLPPCPVMSIQFANDDKTRLATASRDGTLSVFNLTSDPPSLACTLRGHTGAVNGRSANSMYELFLFIRQWGTLSDNGENCQEMRGSGEECEVIGNIVWQ